MPGTDSVQGLRAAPKSISERMANMLTASFLFWPIVLLLVIGLLSVSIRIFREYERGVVFTLGRFWKVKGPGLIFIIPAVQQVVRVDLRTVVLE